MLLYLTHSFQVGEGAPFCLTWDHDPFGFGGNFRYSLLS
ncbi:hypothetical protein LEP1GSC137_2725 [Leptospira borgpetersenii str. Noumea 25]|uniref:Uncharacterized protein n=1 Tax=Leptospira borgpetersenii str. 200801926 TaxID=1193009 RepID=A0ABN0I113_LEPBO|nr:hypothetical protein LEP1GSC128_1714 [Leptospira borgpetersenii str. 200801926]EMO09280.1 hypothetical protein LEP1GSC137_2725 [Leptospira borgpetersenii str. Noumea 25]